MPISHLCISCGLDLARIRAAIEPHYGLPIVACPQCGSVAIRRRHPISARARRAMPLALSLVSLAISTGLAFVFAMATMGICFGVGDTLHRYAITPSGILLSFTDPGSELAADARELIDSGDHLALMGWICWSVMLGIWLGSALPHWRRWALASGFTGAVLALITLFAFVDAMERTDPSAHFNTAFFGHAASLWLRAAWVIIPTLLFSIPGTIIGRLFRRALDLRASGAFGRYRRRLRNRRHRL